MPVQKLEASIKALLALFTFQDRGILNPGFSLTISATEVLSECVEGFSLQQSNVRKSTKLRRPSGESMAWGAGTWGISIRPIVRW